jgi:hypothetical protein
MSAPCTGLVFLGRVTDNESRILYGVVQRLEGSSSSLFLTRSPLVDMHLTRGDDCYDDNSCSDIDNEIGNIRFSSSNNQMTLGNDEFVVSHTNAHDHHLEMCINAGFISWTGRKLRCDGRAQPVYCINVPEERTSEKEKRELEEERMYQSFPLELVALIMS